MGVFVGLAAACVVLTICLPFLSAVIAVTWVPLGLAAETGADLGR